MDLVCRSCTYLIYDIVPFLFLYCTNIERSNRPPTKTPKHRDQTTLPRTEPVSVLALSVVSSLDVNAVLLNFSYLTWSIICHIYRYPRFLPKVHFRMKIVENSFY